MKTFISIRVLDTFLESSATPLVQCIGTDLRHRKLVTFIGENAVFLKVLNVLQINKLFFFISQMKPPSPTPPAVLP